MNHRMFILSFLSCWLKNNYVTTFILYSRIFSLFFCKFGYWINNENKCHYYEIEMFINIINIY